MPILQGINKAMEQAKAIRLQVLEGVKAALTDFSYKREEQVKLSQDERSKINFLAFAIVGSVLGFSPESLQNPFVVIGLGIILLNSFLFGFVADCIQRNNNIANCGSAIDDVMKTVKPYYDSYEDMGKYLDDPEATPEGFQEKYSAMQDAYIEYLEQKKAKGAPRIAQKTKLAIGYKYFVFFAIGLVVLCLGLVLEHGVKSGVSSSLDTVSFECRDAQKGVSTAHSTHKQNKTANKSLLK